MKASIEFRALCEKWLTELHIAARQIVASGEQHAPIMVLKTPAGDLPICIADMNDGEAKQAVAKMQREMAQHYPCVLVTEAWAGQPAKTREDVDRALRQYGSVENMPDRRECITFSFMWQNMQLLAIAFIERRDMEGEDDLLEPPLKYVDTALVDPFVEGGTGTFMLNQREERLQ